MVLERALAIVKRSIAAVDESGQTLVEYSLIVALIAVAAMGTLSIVAGGNDSMWGLISGEVTKAFDVIGP